MPDEASAGLEQSLLQARQRPALDGDRQDQPTQEIGEVVGNHPKQQGAAGQVCSQEGVETRLLIPSPDRRHWLHHCQNNVRRAVREASWIPAGWTRTVGFLNASRPHGAVAHRPTPIDLWVMRGIWTLTGANAPQRNPREMCVSAPTNLG